MNHNVHYVLCGIALVLGVCGIIRPAWPLLGVAVILLAIDGFIKA
jgi:hypothetical protein